MRKKTISDLVSAEYTVMCHLGDAADATKLRFDTVLQSVHSTADDLAVFKALQTSLILIPAEADNAKEQVPRGCRGRSNEVEI